MNNPPHLSGGPWHGFSVQKHPQNNGNSHWFFFPQSSISFIHDLLLDYLREVYYSYETSLNFIRGPACICSVRNAPGGSRPTEKLSLRVFPLTSSLSLSSSSRNHISGWFLTIVAIFSWNLGNWFFFKWRQPTFSQKYDPLSLEKRVTCFETSFSKKEFIPCLLEIPFSSFSRLLQLIATGNVGMCVVNF